MNGSSNTFIESYNHLKDMLLGCQKILNLIDEFNNFLKSPVATNQVVPEYKESVITGEYKNMYGIRKSLFNAVNNYIGEYYNDLKTKYNDAYNILLEIGYEFMIVTSYKTMESLTEVNSLWRINNSAVSYVEFFPYKNFDGNLSKFLRDPLINEIKKISVADSEEKKSGGVTKQANIVTTNVKASQLYMASQSRIVDPATQSWTVKTRAKDIHDRSEAHLKAKKQEHVEQKEILHKLADGKYLSDFVNNLEGKAPTFLKSVYNAPNNLTSLLSDKISKYVLKNLVQHPTVSISDDKDPQGKELKSVLREQTRKKFGDNRFCDEAEQKVNGKWVLKDEAKSLKQLENARMTLRNKILKSMQ
jgi:hypothetical protein